MAKTKPAKSQSARNKKQAGRCWEGYEPTPGKKPGTKGSCKPKASARKGTSSKTKKSTPSHGRKSHAKSSKS